MSIRLMFRSAALAAALLAAVASSAAVSHAAGTNPQIQADSTAAPAPAVAPPTAAPAAADTTKPAPPAAAPTAPPAAAPVAPVAPDTTKPATPEKLPATTPAVAPAAADTTKAAAPPATAGTPAAKPAPRPAAPADAFSRGVTWVTLRGGLARSTEKGSGDGRYGLGGGIRRMWLDRWSFGLYYDWDELGRFNFAKEREGSVTMALARHFKWHTTLHPFLALGTGLFRHEYVGTGRDFSRMLFGTTYEGGADIPVSAHDVIGFALRGAYINNHPDVPNPVFAGERSVWLHATLKLTYSRSF